jgi:hypothetical protein
MPSSNFRASLPSPLVGDASVWINLIATEQVTDILTCIPLPFAVTHVVLDEVRKGRRTGRTTAPTLERLVSSGRVELIDLIDDDAEGFFSLIAGSGPNTLDDGEAATIVCAARLGGTAMIDERKATRLVTSRWPRLPLTTAPDLLHSDEIRAQFGSEGLNAALYGALTTANMHVPERLIDVTLASLSPEQVSKCLSLPARVRRVT